MAVVFEQSINVMAEQEETLNAVGNLMDRGHYLPSNAIAIRELAPKPYSESDAFLPGQRISFLVDGETREHEVVAVQMWHDAEAHVREVVRNSPTSETLEWRLSELTPGTVRITLTYRAEVNPIARLAMARVVKRFWGETLERLRVYLEDKKTFSGPRTWAPKATEQP